MTHKLQIFTRANIYPWQGEGAYSGFLHPVTTSNISKGHYLPRVFGGGSLLLIVQPIPFIKITINPAASTVLAKVTIYPARFTPLFWLKSRPLFQLGCFAFPII